MQRRLHIILMLATLCACNGPDPMDINFRAPEILEVNATKGEDYSQLVLSCRVSSGERIQECGFYFGEDEMVREVAETPIQDKELIQGTEFSLTVTGLAYSSEYQYKAFITSGPTEISSEIKTYRTEDEIPPLARVTTTAYGVDLAWIFFHCEVPDYKNVVRKDAFECGICYSQDKTDPDLDGQHVTGEIVKIGLYYSFSVTIRDFINNIPLCTRPYTKIGPVVTYGESGYPY